MPRHIWIPRNPAESAEALSAEIVSGDRAAPHRAMPSRALACRTAPHLDLHRKDASGESPMLRPPVA